MPDDRSNLLASEQFSFNDDDDDLSIDVDTIMNILDENPDTVQRNIENSTSNDTILAFSPSHNLEISDSRPGISDGSSESSVRSVVCNGGKHESPLLLGSPVQSCCGSLGDWMPIQDNKDKIPHHGASNSLQDYEVTEQGPNCNETFNFSGGDFNPLAIDVGGPSESDFLNQGTEFQFTGFEGDLLPERFSNMQYVEESKLKVLGAPDMVSTAQNYMTMLNPAYSASFLQCDFGDKPLPTSDDEMTSLRNEGWKLLNKDRSSCNSMIRGAQVGDVDRKTLESQMHCNLGAQGLSAHSYNSFSSSISFPNNMGGLPKKQGFHIKDENNAQLIESWGFADLLVDDVIGGKPPGNPSVPYFAEGSNQSYSGCWVSDSSENCNVVTEDEKDIIHDSKRFRLSIDECNDIAFDKCSSVGHDYQFNLKVEPSVVLQGSRSRPQFVPRKIERDIRPDLPDVNVSHVANIRGKEFPNDSSSEQSNTDDDGDVCILEDISGPPRMNISAVNGKPLVPQRTVIYNSFNSSRVGPIRHKANGERFVFQAALQDLCQPKSEDTPPDGVLAVPLLRHQRIALSWMVKKEKDVSRCSGGILADDQGLGKTISTIALILKERSPSSVESNMAQTEPETLNLDEDEDEVSDVGKSNQGAQSGQGNGNISDGKNISGQGKCRPAAGTLIVCPTSVLRQWSEELQNKVTKKANLSFLVYHGSNRTKNPSELAKFDVVLTTYAIVSMEVPKQPLVDEDDDDTKCASGSPMDFSSLKRRKYPPSAAKKSLKGKKGHEDELVEPVARPLACVGWFRVVLDEAQSIKNHRTQVARACWGLRAKRRWCLSGTPIQNAVDDLYSYFRFLRFDPYSAYKAFCSGLKGPIQKSPANGYRKLQAVLKAVMLRRTKCTLLDGEPIINLPAKTIKLKRVDFTEEERDFYCRLEADSRAQFAEYAAAGTVKQNYVNILLMLLRLRQACDHPLLVRKSDSSSIQRSSIEMAKKLPREKQIHLLTCLEASLAICGICSDPPEDAVVTSCGHVFCNQCICEHLSGDDTHCPTANCKTHLRTSLLFSIATLRSSLFDEPTMENSSDCSSIEMGEGHEPFSSSRLYGSSKINVVLEVLQSLTRQPDCTKESCSSSVDDGTPITENNANLHSGMSFENLHNDENAVDGVSNDSATVVGEKAIVFSQWTRMLDLLEDCLKNSSIQYRRLDGTMSVAARDKAVKDFNSLPEVSVMIMSLKAASLGLNMVAACHVILLDLWWNPTTEDQAIDRAHRIGQTRPVTVLRLTVKDTVEDRILALQQKKREMVASAFGEDETGSRQTRLTVEDLKYLFMDE